MKAVKGKVTKKGTVDHLMDKENINSHYPVGQVCKVCNFGAPDGWTDAITGQNRTHIATTCFRFSDVCGKLICRIKAGVASKQEIAMFDFVEGGIMPVT